MNGLLRAIDPKFLWWFERVDYVIGIVMMKNNIRIFLLIALATVILGCAKEEAVLKTTSATSSEDWPSEVQYYALRPPYDEGGPGIDAQGLLNFPTNPEFNFPYGPDKELPRFPFSVIEVPNKLYLKETCLFDVSKLENNKTYHKLQNGSLTIGFIEGSGGAGERRVLKLKSSSAKGWNSQWGFSPTVEQEDPDVFYFHLYNSESMFLYLSKPCIEFGFEVAPNHKNYDHNFYVDYGDWIRDDSKGSVMRTTKSPSGARLYAVKATKPFRMITITSTGSPTAAPLADGLAIANIRYRLAD
jgi:hypothetical protein